MAKRGRKKKFTKKLLKVAKEMFENGALDKEVCKACKISHTVFYEYVRDYPEFAEARKMGKKIAACDPESNLRKAAKGYDYEEKTIEVRINKNGEEEPAYIKKVTKHVPMSVAANFILLKNYDPEEWKDRHEIDASFNDGKGISVTLQAVPAKKNNEKSTNEDEDKNE